VSWREEVARTKVRRFREWTYWARRVPGFGDARAGLSSMGLAPRRTGEPDRTDVHRRPDGDFLYAALHRRIRNQPTAFDRATGCACRAFIHGALPLAPPENKPRPTS